MTKCAVEDCTTQPRVEAVLSDIYTNPEVEGIKAWLCYEHLEALVMNAAMIAGLNDE